MPERRRARGIVDTSVVIDLEQIDPCELPAEIAISAVTLAGRRALDLLTAATALAAALPLYTRKPDDFRELEGLLEVIVLQPVR